MGFCLFVSMQQNPRWRVGLVFGIVFGTTGAPFEKETEPPDGGDQRGVSIVLPVCEPPRARPGLRLCLENRRSRLEDPQTDRVRDPTGRKRPGCKPHASHVAHRPVARAVPRIAVRAAVACALLLANHRKPLPTSVRAADLLSGSRLFDLLPPGEIFYELDIRPGAAHGEVDGDDAVHGRIHASVQRLADARGTRPEDQGIARA